MSTLSLMPKGKCKHDLRMLICNYISNTHTSSRNFTGKATANYPNGDTYVGDFKDGVSANQHGLRLIL